MAFITADRVKDTSTTTGTGNITVSGSAPFGYQTFSTVLSVGDTFYYAIQGQSTAEWEIGLGTYASTNQFARTTVLASSASGSAVSFSSGTKNVFITLAAARTVQTDPSGTTPVAGSIPYGTGTAVSYSSAGTAGQVLTSGGTGVPTWTTITGTGTVTSVNVSGGTTGLTTSGGPVTTSGTITMAGTLAVANGGTGLTTTPANGALDIGNGTGFTRTTLTAGSNISITNGAGSITIASTGGSGTPGGSTTQVQYNSSGSFAGSANLTFDGTNLTSGGTLVMGSSFKRNRIINGNMLIDQRNAGASVTVNAASATFCTDRWYGYGQGSDGVFTLQQVADYPAGFTTSIKATVTTADSSIGATQLYFLSQIIEANNMVDLGWGASGAQTITLSFWVKSSLTGTFGGSLGNNSNYSYPFTFTISAANTWEQKSITVTGPTAGTWGTGTAAGIKVVFSLGAGSSKVGTAGSWSANDYLGATGQTQIISTNGATFYLTGVQLEVGTKATPYEMQIYSDQLVQCQRYYCKTFPIGTAPADNINAARNGTLNVNTIGTTSAYYSFLWHFPVVMRVTPTISTYNPSSGTAGYWFNPAGPTYTAAAVNFTTDSMTNVFLNSGNLYSDPAGSGPYYVSAAATAEL